MRCARGTVARRASEAARGQTFAGPSRRYGHRRTRRVGKPVRGRTKPLAGPPRPYASIGDAAHANVALHEIPARRCDNARRVHRNRDRRIGTSLLNRHLES